MPLRSCRTAACRVCGRVCAHNARACAPSPHAPWHAHTHTHTHTHITPALRQSKILRVKGLGLRNSTGRKRHLGALTWHISPEFKIAVKVCLRACVRACARVCVRVRVFACVCVCAWNVSRVQRKLQQR
jgi:hypothetical protein